MRGVQISAFLEPEKAFKPVKGAWGYGQSCIFHRFTWDFHRFTWDFHRFTSRGLGVVMAGAAHSSTRLFYLNKKRLSKLKCAPLGRDFPP